MDLQDVHLQACASDARAELFSAEWTSAAGHDAEAVSVDASIPQACMKNRKFGARAIHRA